MIFKKYSEIESRFKAAHGQRCTNALSLRCHLHTPTLVDRDYLEHGKFLLDHWSLFNA